MVLRIALFISMAVGLLGLGGVGWLAMHADSRPAPAVVHELAPPPPPPAMTVPILVAAKALRAGALIKPDDLVTQEVPKTDVPANATVATRADRFGLVGGMLRRSLQPSDPVLTPDVMLPGDHGFLAAVLQPGMRAGSIAVDAVSSSSGLVWPGDRIDLVLTQAIEDQKLPIGRRLSGEIVGQDLRVVAVDATLVRGAMANGGDPQPAHTITLEMTPEQEERLSVAARIGKIGIFVRSAENASATDFPQHAIWASDVSKALDARVPNTGGDGIKVRVFTGPSDPKEFVFQ